MDKMEADERQWRLGIEPQSAVRPRYSTTYCNQNSFMFHLVNDEYVLR